MPNSDNQADGFKDDGDGGMVDAFAAASAATGIPDTSQWRWWFDLKQAAGFRDWVKVQKLLDDNKSFDLPYHSFTAEFFHTAANLGKVDVVKEIFRRKFSLPEEEGAETVDRLIKYYPETGLPAAVYLVANKHASPDKAVSSLAVNGKPETMAALKKQGFDILQGGNSFFLAYYSANVPMMDYLYSQGANLYTAPIVAGLYGRSAEIKPEAADAYRRLVAFDASQLQMYYAYVAPNVPSIEDFRQVPGGMVEKNQTLMHLCAQAGHFHEVISASMKEVLRPLAAEDLLRKDVDGVSVLMILAGRGELKDVFDPKLWARNPDGARDVHAALKEFRAENLVDDASFRADIQQHNLRAQAQAGRWSLKPKGKP